MRTERYAVPALTLAALAGAASRADAQALTAVRLPAAFTRPVFVTAPPGDTSRIFVCEQRGSALTANRADIKIFHLDTNTLNATPFLTISPVSTFSEQGLLGLAFDPNYATNGLFYVSYTNTTGVGNSTIMRYHVSANADIADAASGTLVLSVTQPFNNHNGGWIGFGPDNMFYAAFGDGGSEQDPNNVGQNQNTLLSKILRLDVTTLPYTIPPTNPWFGLGGVRQETWAWGLRNPWRPSFDRATGDLWIADVGQDAWEEINFQGR